MTEIRIKRSSTIRHVFIGNGYYDLRLGIGQLKELQETTRKGIVELFGAFVGSKAGITDITEVIRCGLIGGGLAPEKAFHLTQTYVTDGYIAEYYIVASSLLQLVWEGVPEDVPLEEGPADDGGDEKKNNT